MSMQDDVKRFHKVFRQPVAERPQMIDLDRAEKRMGWLEDEVQEYLDAVAESNIVEAYDGLVDILYFLMGTFVEHGFDAQAGFDEAHASNMSKICEDGFPIYYADGKIAKGPNYFNPNLPSVLARQIVEAAK